MKRNYLVFLLLAAISLVLGACSNNDKGEANSSNDGNDGSSKEQVLTIGLPTDIDTFDIHNTTSSATEAVLTNMFSYLYKRTDELELQPDLAESYQIIDDKTWEFKLKPGVTFHNGDPLTAEDVKFTFERVAKDPSLKRNSYFTNFEEVEVVDELTLRIHTKTTEPLMLNRISRNGLGILPKKYIEENGLEHFLKNPIGSGPYQFKEWAKDSHITLTSYKDHFELKPEWDKVVFRVIPETSTRVGELIAGGVDLISNVPPTEWDRINDNDGTSITEGDSTRVMQLIVRHTEGSVTSDPRVREAIDLAINKEVLVDHINKGAAIPTRTGTPFGVTGAHPDLNNSFVYDPERAKKLLEEAGYGNGVEINLQSSNGRYTLDSDVAQIIATMLEEVGFKVNLELLENSRYLDVYDAHQNKELFLIGLSNSLFDGSHALEYFYTEGAKGMTDYSNPEFDKLFALSEENMNLEEREQQLQKMQEIVAEDRPNINLYQMKTAYGIRDHITFDASLTEHFYVPSIHKK
ncbi:ABC transporter substrate-binding protein [Sporosarcina koreensis]|uniref:ABC transporter substrate-binding protein n=1 Tax=Sporosarcina koreensis TaxID=334735 RepID=UPI00075B3CD5|nr:ABC transporter substrate-binding protein [Sporosarcina koreensis]